VLAVLALVAACGDNALPDVAGLAPAQDLAIVAHADDDLLFMQPDLIEAVRAGTGVTIVYVTAGNDDRDLDYARERYDGVMAAYSAVTAATAWSCGWFELAGHAAEHCRLAAANLSLVFLGYPDGGKQGQFASSLLALWQGRIAGADTVAERSAHYDREGLVATLAAAIVATDPRTIRTLEVASTHGNDHSDHMLVGALAVLARARAGGRAELLSYRGYDIAGEPADDFPPITKIADDAFARYSACAEGCAACGDACATFSATYAGYLQRHYAVHVNRVATGVLASTDGCATLGGIVDCAAAPIWRFDGDIARIGDACIAVGADGAVATTTCDAATSLSLDEEGHVWVGVAPATVTELDHLDCLAVIDGVVRATPCGGDGAATWSLLPATVTTPRAALGLAQTGRAIRLADLTGDELADLCADDGTEVWCAAGDGAGGFAPAMPIAALAIEPDSLAIGVLDGRLDACGRDAAGQGIVCASSLRLAAFGHAGPANAGDRSLAIIGGELCGLAPDGVICASPAGVRVVSAWPARDAALWPADLDGDFSADWCSATPDGPACGRAADRALSTDGVAWAFSLAGAVDANAATAATGALADGDGDGRADWCAIDGTRVSCAFSHGSGFGPRAPVMELATAPTALWIDTGGELCVDTGTAVTCATSRAPPDRAPTDR
jgi:LmbE family N-acetylglucosaminyl deacetylase